MTEAEAITRIPGISQPRSHPGRDDTLLSVLQLLKTAMLYCPGLHPWTFLKPSIFERDRFVESWN